MKYLLFLLVILLTSCHLKQPSSIILNANWQCDNNTVTIAANVYAPKPIPAVFEIFRDANKNGEFDNSDQMERLQTPILIPVNDLYLSQPIELSELWKQGKIFIRVSNGSDTLVRSIDRCSNIKTNYSN